MKIKTLKVNKKTVSRKMVLCASPVNKSAITRKQINGVEHIIISSYTLPDDVVMNGGLYPADEIAASFHTLERTLAPVEHPTDENGNFILASDPEAIHNFHAGAFNVNVSRSNGRVHIEKHVNVQEALKTDRGKRLLDRIHELETSEDPRPVHTSVGVLLEVESLDAPRANAAGDEYSWIARNMLFDHDAILLDSIGAATPEKGVGMAVNSKGDQIPVERFVAMDRINSDPPVVVNASGQSFRQIEQQLQQQLNGIVASDWLHLFDVYPVDQELIFETPQGYFSVPFTMRDGMANISGVPIRVDKEVEFQPKINSKTGEERMKELILNALAKAGIETDGLSEDQLLAAYNKLMTKNPAPDNDGGATAEQVSEAIGNAVKPLVEKVEALTAKVNAQSDAERDKLVDTVVNSKKYPGVDEAAAKALPLESLKEMAANCGAAHGLPFANDSGEPDDTFSAPNEMPK